MKKNYYWIKEVNDINDYSLEYNPSGLTDIEDEVLIVDIVYLEHINKFLIE